MWHLKEIKDIYIELETSEKGLTRTKAKNKLEKDGLNALPEGKKKTIISIFFSQFINPIIYILGFAGLFSLFIGEYLDMLFILMVVFRPNKWSFSDLLIGRFPTI